MAEPVFDGRSSRRLIELARRSRMTLGAGLVERGARGEFYNTYVVATSDGSAQRHRKLHAFEHESILNGSDYTVFDLPERFRAGVLICYDCNLIENVRLTALRGAEILIAPHQTGGGRPKKSHLIGLIGRPPWGKARPAP